MNFSAKFWTKAQITPIFICLILFCTFLNILSSVILIRKNVQFSVLQNGETENATKCKKKISIRRQKKVNKTKHYFFRAGHF